MTSPRERISVALTQTPAAEGKTKRVHLDPAAPENVFMYSTNFITAGDGARQGEIKGKGMASNQTSVNVFLLLERNGIKTAFLDGFPDDDCPVFYSQNCKMRPYEVVVRRKATGSYRHRHPEIDEGHIFSDLLVEFYLKTTGKQWKGRQLECDDPLMIVQGDEIHLHHPKKKFDPDKPFLVLLKSEVYDSPVEVEEAEMAHMAAEATKAFLVLEAAWKDAPDGGELIDFKVEFGKNAQGELVLADIIDADSWRVISFTGEALSKQPWRDGCTDDEMLAILQKVVQISSHFRIYEYKVAA